MLDSRRYLKLEENSKLNFFRLSDISSKAVVVFVTFSWKLFVGQHSSKMRLL